jgi:hypothetical protein
MTWSMTAEAMKVITKHVKRLSATDLRIFYQEKGQVQELD